MADDMDTSKTPPAAEESAAPDSAPSESEAQDPSSSSSSTAADASAAAAGASEPGEAAAGALSSLSLASGGGAPAGQPQPPAPPPRLAPAVAQHLPMNLPAADLDDLDDLDDEDAAALDNEFLSLLPPCILPRVDRLKDLNDRRDDILDEYRKERAALELKFGARMKPLYEERRGVVMGEYDGALGEDKKDLGEAEAEEGVVEDVAGEEGEGQDVKGIPQFWACAMGHVDVIAELITEADVDCLDHLTDITCLDFPDGLGFELRFHFSPENPFFTNTVLTKRYEVPNLLTEDEPILKNVTGCDINWKPDQSLTYREVTKKQRKKGGPNAGQIRTLKKQEQTESFFHFFTPPKMPALAEVIDEEEADAVEEAFDHDYDVAQAFRGHLIPRAVLWFTGEAVMMDEEMEDEMIAAQEGGGAGPQPFAFDPNGGANPFPPPAAGNGENPECKQN